MRAIAACALVVAFTVAAAPVAAQGTDEVGRRRALEHYRTGLPLLVAERYEQAATEFSAAIELDPLITLAHYGLGQANMGLKRYPSAIQAFIGCRDAYARIATLRQSNASEFNRRLDDEINELRNSVQRVRSGQIKGATESTAMQLEKRLDDLGKIRQERVRGEVMAVPAEVSLALGSAYYRSGQAADAEREWRQAVSVNPRLGEAHNNLAVLYMQSRRKADAEAAVKAAERARFRVHPQLKEDIKNMTAGQ
jgi:tetratricopeptide (TPR) repeat protein